VTDPILSVTKVVREYGERVRTRALAGVDLVMEQGEFAALIGPSGSGKSTLLNIVGLLDRPTTGRVILTGIDTSGLNDGALTALRARTLGFVFQFHHLLPAFTAQENVMMPLLADRGGRDEEMEDRASALLDEVGLADRASYPAMELSGGEQQRVALARSLVMRPSLVLADEPTGNLDSESGAQVFRLLRTFNERYGTAFVIVTHDDRLAVQCDRTVHMVDGRVESDT
jgi:lipoprotein-releasing system ATP-binding protein